MLCNSYLHQSDLPGNLSCLMNKINEYKMREKKSKYRNDRSLKAIQTDK